jgi:hypothetical protein
MEGEAMMAKSTRDILDKVESEKNYHAMPLDTSLDMSKARLIQKDGEEESPRTPNGSPRKNSNSRPGLTNSPRYADLTKIPGEGIETVKQDGIYRRKSSGSLSNFKVTKKDSSGDIKKPGDTKPVDVAPKTSPRK